MPGVAVSSAANASVCTAVEAFDRVAASYDDLFTRTVIGQAQRKQVWKRLLRAYAPGDRILELNCGTGEDARFLATRGRSIVACDGSAEMINVANARAQQEVKGADLIFKHLANEDLGLLAGRQRFDGAYSNFSGLNCLSDLRPVASELASLVRPGGRVLICVWSRVCVGEVVWYLVHGETRKAMRRFSGKAKANVGGLTITVSYPSVNAVRRAFAPWFDLESRRAIGLFVPPSYVESWARKHSSLMGYLEKMDGMLAELPVLRDLGDHVLLEFTRCNP
jgi:ubiquinone/menaquinone biosynthesis C-methylase UbiE